MTFTVLGAGGFVGRHLVQLLQRREYKVLTPTRLAVDDFCGRPTVTCGLDYYDVKMLHDENLGHVIYCIGLTADFRERPFDTARAHVSVLADVLEHCRYDSLTYLSSTRVYITSTDTREEAPLVVNPGDPSDLYNLSKLMGESLCLSKPNTKIARLSNVVGDNPDGPDFASSLARDAKGGKIVLRSDPRSSKDYIDVRDVCALLEKIATCGKLRIYNVASGFNATHQQVVDDLVSRFGCAVEFSGGPLQNMPLVNVDRIREEFGFRPLPLFERTTI